MLESGVLEISRVQTVSVGEKYPMRQDQPMAQAWLKQAWLK
jgi:hypothetical protein